jgi:broad specificity phosphatase PhoE
MRLSAALLVVSALAFAAPAAAQRAVVIVRHAEKASQTEKDPELSLTGEDRAIALTRFLRGMKVDAIFVTELKRTQATAAPLARQRALKPEIVNADDVAGLIGKLRALPKDAVAVVVGHSNTIPLILKQLGVSEDVKIRDDEYARVFVVVPAPGGGSGLLEFAYDT